MVQVHHGRASELVPTTPGERVATADRRILMRDEGGKLRAALVAARGDKGTPRIAFLDGDLELMGPSRDHERIKAYLSRLLETYALERGQDLSAYGAWTLHDKLGESGLEPDECYILGADQDKERPDLAIEVVWTSGGIGKLEIYRRLGVPEVWQWKDDVLEVHLLHNGAYERVDRSEAFPELDLSLLCSFLDHPTLMQAVRAFRAQLRDR